MLDARSLIPSSPQPCALVLMFLFPEEETGALQLKYLFKVTRWQWQSGEADVSGRPQGCSKTPTSVLLPFFLATCLGG